MSAPSFAPVHVGHTAFPLKLTTPQADRAWPVPPGAGPTFRLLDGPPYANGALHLGHLLNKHLKDLTVRAAAAAGHPVEWLPRWDCHGLPVEVNVERAGHQRAEALAFVQAARGYAAGQVEAQRTTFETQGLSAEWDHPVCTMDPDQQAATLRVVAELLDRERLVVRREPTPWCPTCRSTVAGAEQESRAVSRTNAWVPFFLADGEVLLSWTTTPWTLPFHAGLVLHPQAPYRAFTWSGRRVWVSDASWPQVQRAFEGAQLESEERLGQELDGRTYRTAWGQLRVVHTDARVQPAAGTGCLHAVPAFDPFDAALGRQWEWEVTEVLGEDGVLGPSAWPPLVGMRAGEPASAVVLAWLSKQAEVSPWLRQWSETVEVPCCWRHQTPLLVRPSRQVFLAMTEDLRAQGMALADTVTWAPTNAKDRVRALMLTRPDWCLSRQRTWGVPLALLLDPLSGQPHVHAAEVVRRVAAAVATEGVEAWWSSPKSRWTEGMTVEPQAVWVNDVLDVWFDSGAVGVHQGVHAEVVVEGHDQLRGWFQACLWVAAALDRPAPFRMVACHGFVVDAQGRKLSKSTGGDAAAKGAAPHWSTLPADVVRLWAAMGEMGADRPWSPATVTAAQQAYARLRNSVRFALANVPEAAWRHTGPWASHDWPALDRWNLDVGQQTWHQARADFLAGRPDAAVRAVTGYVDQHLSRGLYDRLKDRLYCAPEGSAARAHAVGALRTAAEQLLTMLEVVAPQLRAEVETWLPSGRCPMGHLNLVLSPAEAQWVTESQQVRDHLNAHWETLGAKGGLERARLTLDHTWPVPVWEAQEALGVGQWVRRDPGANPLPTVWGPARVEPSSDPLCPRCRRPGATETGVCPPCAQASHAPTWR